MSILVILTYSMSSFLCSIHHEYELSVGPNRDLISTGPRLEYRALFSRQRIPVAFIASLLYLVCKMEKVGRTVDEICAATGGAATRQEVWKIQSKIRRDMGIVVGHVTPEEVVTRIGRASKQSRGN